MTRRSRARLASVLGAGLLLGTPSPSAAEQDPVLVESGRRSFLRHCSACHGVEGTGDGPVAPVLRTPPSDLTRIAARRGGEFPDAEIAEWIDGRRHVTAHGPRDMPVWGRVFARPVADGSTGEEMVRGQLWVLVEYLKTLQRESPRVAPPRTIRRESP